MRMSISDSLQVAHDTGMIQVRNRYYVRRDGVIVGCCGLGAVGMQMEGGVYEGKKGIPDLLVQVWCMYENCEFNRLQPDLAALITHLNDEHGASFEVMAGIVRGFGL